MRLVSIELSGYRQFRDRVTLDLPTGLTGICGPNGVGKSKLIEAIGYALYGPRRGLLPAGDTAADIPSKPDAEVVPRVSLVIEIDGQCFEVNRSKHSRGCNVRIVGEETFLAETPKGVTEKVIELLHLPPDAFLGTFVARQREVATLQAANATTRQKLINRLIGISLVETALELAQKRREDAFKALETVKAGIGESVSLMQGRLDEYRDALVVAEEQMGKATSLRVIAFETLKKSDEKKEALHRDSERCSAQEKELKTLRDHLETIQKEIVAREVDVNSAEGAEATIARAQTIINETKEADSIVATQDAIYALDEIRKGIAANNERLATYVHPKLHERLQEIGRTERIQKEMETLRVTLSELDGFLIAARQEFGSASKQEKKHAARKQNVMEMGPDGICDACGQALGANVEQALRHLENERLKAQLQKDTVQSRILELEADKESTEHKLSDYQREHAELLILLKSYEPVLREQIQIEEAQNQLSNQIEGAPELVRNLRYDFDLHEAARNQCRQRQNAEIEITANSKIADSADRAREVLDQYRQQYLEKQQEEASLNKSVDTLKQNLSTLELVKEEHSISEQAFEKAETSRHDAESNFTTAKVRIEEAEAEIERAKAHWARVELAEHAATVAFRTEELMQSLVREVTAEASPRIMELMEGWARSLMGPHFRRIELSPDYRIFADNGSGLHQIDHFSGGEQTLLAIMLRVAISIYCQERAGFSAGFLILDEVFGDQDEAHRTQLVQFLNDIKSNYHQIIIVNHVSDVTGMLDSIIEVTATGERTSKAVLSH